MAEVRLDTPLVEVTLSDGRQLTARVLNPDYLVWDRTAAKHGWPSMTKAPYTWLTFVAWAALRREQKIDGGVSWEEFSEQLCIQVKNANREQVQDPVAAELAELVGAALDSPDGVDPTLSAPEPV